MINLKLWLYSKTNNKKYKKQQFLKALKLSYINRKKALNSKKFFVLLEKKCSNLINIGIKTKLPIVYYNNISFNWLLKK